MTTLPANLRDVDWSETSFDGARRAHLRRWKLASFEEVVKSLEEMEVLMHSWDIIPLTRQDQDTSQ